MIELHGGAWVRGNRLNGDTAKGGGRPRVWDVVVTNADGSSGMCVDCFTVNP